MKKLAFVFLALLAVGCDNDNRSSDRGEKDSEEKAPVYTDQSDSSSIHYDSATSGGLNGQTPYDTAQ